MIQVRDVTKRYGTLTAVDHVSFSVARGEIVGFVGPNGAGKSTMLRMLSTFLHPTSGSIEMNGLDVRKKPRAVRQAIGYLPGDTPLYPTMRVDQFLDFVGRARGLRDHTLKRGFERAVTLCRLAPVLSQRIDRCSTGYRQRVGLASALIHDPPILLLDEPTHGFDPLQVMAFRDMLSGLRAEHAILFSTHIIADVEQVSDRVLIIHEGRLLGDGTIAELAERAGSPDASLEPVFARLVASRDESQGTPGSATADDGHA